MNEIKQTAAPEAAEQETVVKPLQKPMPKEIGGPKGPEPTRYGDWERNGRCTDF
jgi:hypothetical protein